MYYRASYDNKIHEAKCYEIEEEEGIWLSKKLLEEYKAHYLNVAEVNRDSWKNNKDTFKFPFYEGKAEVLYNILKMFDELEG